MLDQITWNLLGNIAFAIGVSFTLTALARVVSHRIGLLDWPDNGRKAHLVPTPLLGGVALYISVAAAFLLAWCLRFDWLAANPEVLSFTTILLISGGLFCLVGLWDDKHSLRARTKLLLQIAASIPFVIWGRSIESIQLLGAELALGPCGAWVTIFWLVACANVINLVDGLDGLAGTIGVIICVAVAAHSEMQGLIGPASVALIVAGGLLGFLLHNWPPAKIFLGDSGSLTLGFFVGALSLESSLKRATGFALAVPLVLMSVPVFDALMAILRRKLNGRAVGQPDRGHIHHCLQNRGLTRFQTLVAIAGLSLTMAAAALVSAYFQNDLLALGICVSLLLLLIAGRVFGNEETLMFFRCLRVISLMLARASGLLRVRLLLARSFYDEREHSFSCLEQVAKQVEQLGGTRLEFLLREGHSEDVIHRLCWPKAESPEADAAFWEIHYSRPRSPNAELIVKASGHRLKRAGGQHPDELFRTFDALCRSWPLDIEFGCRAQHDRFQFPLSTSQQQRGHSQATTQPVSAEQSVDGLLDVRPAA